MEAIDKAIQTLEQAHEQLTEAQFHMIHYVRLEAAYDYILRHKDEAMIAHQGGR